MKLFRVAKSIAAPLAAVLLLAGTAWAAPKVEISITAEKDVVVEEGGQKVSKRVPAAEATPGETVIFTISFTNSGDEAATNVNIDDPIPAGTAYVVGSASEVGDVFFSIDGGQSYKQPSLLTYEITHPDGSREKKVASPEQYTHIRWRIPQIDAGAAGAVSFSVKVR